jgi:hypothetical protein
MCRTPEELKAWSQNLGHEDVMTTFRSSDSRHYPQERGARFAEGGGRLTGMPLMTFRLRYRILKLRALC